MKQPRSLLTIAGTDPTGGAGVLADINVFRDHGFHGLAVVTSVFAQNTAAVRAAHHMPADIVAAQLEAVLEDVRVSGVKIGVLGSAGSATAVVDRLRALERPIVLDTVLHAGADGTALAGPGVGEVLVESLMPLSHVVTPNVAELGALVGGTVTSLDDAIDAARTLIDRGARAVLVKGGHLPAQEFVVDVLVTSAAVTELEPLPRVQHDVRGTGCQLASAILAGLADGHELIPAIERARSYLNSALRERTTHIGRKKPVVVRTEAP